MGRLKPSSDGSKGPGPGAFLRDWAVSSLSVWILVCLYGLVFMFPILEAGLVPWEVILSLALIPIALVAFLVRTCLFFLVRMIRPFSRETGQKLFAIGTPVLTGLTVLILILLAGGPDAFVPRL